MGINAVERGPLGSGPCSGIGLITIAVSIGQGRLVFALTLNDSKSIKQVKKNR